MDALVDFDRSDKEVEQIAFAYMYSYKQLE